MLLVCIAGCLVVGAGIAVAQAPGDVLTDGPSPGLPRAGFDYCSAPATPPCVEAGATYASESAIKACDREIERFTHATFAYRECIDRELRRVILDVNSTVRRFRCRVARKGNCR